MNKRMYTIALLISAMPFLSLAESTGVRLTENDFVSAEKKIQDGETRLQLKLSKSGKAKFKKLDWNQIDRNVFLEIAGVVKNFKLKAIPQGDALETGPYLDGNADRVIRAIDVQNSNPE